MVDHKFQPGDRVVVTMENQAVEVPDNEEWENLGNHHIPIGTELEIPDYNDDKYDGYDNSWLFFAPNGTEVWIHERALDYALKPVTQDEEDAALESIRKALT